MSTNLNTVTLAFSGLDDAFPVVDPMHEPCAEFVIVQIRNAKRFTASGLELPDEAFDTEKCNTQVAKVIALGPLAFRNRSTGEPWPGGNWYNVGDFVRSPKYGGDRWSVKMEIETAESRRGNLIVAARKNTVDVEFALFKDLDIRSRITGDPLAIRSFI